MTPRSDYNGFGFGMKKVGKMLKDAIGRDEVLRAARAHSALRSWPQVVGSVLASRSTPDRYERGTVWVAVQGSAWAQELRMMKPMILERLSALADEKGLFTDVRFGVRPVQEGPFQPIPEPNRPRAKPEIPEMSIRELAELRMAKWTDEERTRT